MKIINYMHSCTPCCTACKRHAGRPTAQYCRPDRVLDNEKRIVDISVIPFPIVSSLIDGQRCGDKVASLCVPSSRSSGGGGVGSGAQLWSGTTRPATNRAATGIGSLVSTENPCRDV